MGGISVDYGGVNHLALVCSDKAATVAFYEGLLGMALVKTIELPAGLGTHLFFDCGNGDCLAFFWFPDAEPPMPGISGPGCRPDTGPLTSAVGSMNHVAFTIPLGALEGARAALVEAGVACSEIAYHDDSEWGLATDPEDPGVFVASLYFQDPDGILLEFAAWTRALGPQDVDRQLLDGPSR